MNILEIKKEIVKDKKRQDKKRGISIFAGYASSR
jgi:hypothetical protein